MAVSNLNSSQRPAAARAPSSTGSTSQASQAQSSRSSLSRASSLARFGRSKTSLFAEGEVCNLTFSSLDELATYNETPYRSVSDGLCYSREQLERYLGFQYELKGPNGLTSPVTGQSMRKDGLALRVFAPENNPSTRSLTQAKPTGGFRIPTLARRPPDHPLNFNVHDAVDGAKRAYKAARNPRTSLGKMQTAAKEAWLDWRILRQQAGGLFS